MTGSSVRIVASCFVFVVAASLFAMPATAASGANRDLATARAASAAFHDSQVAIDAGYASTPDCVAAPGLGTMGFHYVKFALFDMIVEVKEPEAVLYAYDADGAFRLVGIEYLAVALANTPTGPAPWFDAAAPPAGFFNPSPVLFGRTFDGPMAGHGPGMPWHYDLHVWIWAHNPSGTFAQFNPAPNVTCVSTDG